MSKVDTLNGSNTYRYLGLQVLPTVNTGGSNQFWFTSRKSSADINLHSVVVFTDLGNGKKYAEAKWDLFGYSS